MATILIRVIIGLQYPASVCSCLQIHKRKNDLKASFYKYNANAVINIGDGKVC